MPYQISAEPGLLRAVFSGRLTRADLLSVGMDVARVEGGYAETPHRITDMRLVDGVDVSFPDVLELAQHRRARTLTRAVRSAIVAPDALRFGYARMFQTLSEHPQITIQIFATMEEAEAWVAGGTENVERRT